MLSFKNKQEIKWNNKRTIRAIHRNYFHTTERTHISRRPLYRYQYHDHSSVLVAHIWINLLLYNVNNNDVEMSYNRFLIMT